MNEWGLIRTGKGEWEQYMEFLILKIIFKNREKNLVIREKENPENSNWCLTDTTSPVARFESSGDSLRNNKFSSMNRLLRYGKY